MEIKTLHILKDQIYPQKYTKQNEQNEEKGEKVGIETVRTGITVKTSGKTGGGAYIWPWVMWLYYGPVLYFIFIYFFNLNFT